MRRILKQLTISFVFACILVGGAFIFWRLFLFQVPTCTDGIRNQQEVGVDCGGSCASCVATPQELSLGPATFVEGENRTYDVFFTIENPNSQWGVKSVPYRLILEDSAGSVVAERRNVTFLLPLESHPVVEQTIVPASPGVPVRVRIELDEVFWVEVARMVRDDQLVVLDQRFVSIPSGPDFAELRAIIRNDAPFTYDLVQVHVILADQAGRTIGIRRTEMRTLRSGARREFRVAWRIPFLLTGEPKITVAALTNVFENENFVREYGTIERFQELR